MREDETSRLRLARTEFDLKLSSDPGQVVQVVCDNLLRKLNESGRNLLRHVVDDAPAELKVCVLKSPFGIVLSKARQH